jgi:hypothetical protein
MGHQGHGSTWDMGRRPMSHGAISPRDAGPELLTQIISYVLRVPALVRFLRNRFLVRPREHRRRTQKRGQEQRQLQPQKKQEPREPRR